MLDLEMAVSTTPRNCHKCNLGCGTAVPGYGPKHPKLIVISDYPGAKETEEGRPMVGRSGQLLRNALRGLVGIDPERDVFYATVIRCETGTKQVGATHISACKRWINDDLREVQCDLVLITGGLAFDVMLPQIVTAGKEDDGDFGISRAHGKIYHYLGKTYMVTWNPAFVEQYKFKDPRRGGRVGRKMEYPDWYPTGSVPFIFKRDMATLKKLIEDTYGPSQ